MPVRGRGSAVGAAETKIVAKRPEGGICNRCYRGPETTCSRCGRIRACQRITSGEPICHTCYARDERPRMTCARCERDLSVMTYWPIGPVCQTCYTTILRSPAECARCNASHPLIARDEDGAGVCGPCVGHDADYTCRQCGRSGNPYGHGRCAFCVLADKVNDLFTGPDGTISPQLQPLADALIRTHAPFKAIQWVHEHPGKPVAHAHLVRPFLHWFLLRRARNRASTRAYLTTVGRDLRRRVLVALDILAWIDAQGTTLGDLRQDDLDRWLDEEDTQRRNRIRYFLNWTTGRGLSRRLTVPLILLFALQAQRIRHLTADQLTQNGDDTYLTAGRHPMLLPPRLGALLRELASRPATPLMIPHGPNTPRWLFPGRVPGQPVDGHSLTNLLNRHGVSARPAHNGALSAHLPAAILADLLGLHVNTAVRWVIYARRDWTDYLAARATEHGKPQRDE